MSDAVRGQSSEPVNPVQVEKAIREIANEIAKGVRSVSESLAEFRRLEREYDRAFAQAYMRHSGAAHAKRYAAELATQIEREARDTGEVVWKYAATQSRALELELSAYQSIARSVNGMFGAAGSG